MIIGMEFSLKRLAAIKKSVFIVGAAQVGFTTVATALVAWWFGFAVSAALFLGRDHQGLALHALGGERQALLSVGRDHHRLKERFVHAGAGGPLKK